MKRIVLLLLGLLLALPQFAQERKYSTSVSYTHLDVYKRQYELFYRTMSMFPTWNPWNEDGSPAAGWSNQDGNPYYWKDKLTRSTTNRKTSFNIGFALEILPQQLFLNGNSSMYYTCLLYTSRCV